MEKSLNQNKVWGWGELALLYFPNISQKSATMQLLKWVRVSDELVLQLQKSGWHPGKKYLTPQAEGLHRGAPRRTVITVRRDVLPHHRLTGWTGFRR
ncbi:MAG: DUF4248 domain-containing protein [Parabacteroides sp.]|nr:DUF4248 domain-containing protein [Parabacteroides sp.]